MYIYDHQGYRSLTFFSCSVLIWIWYDFSLLKLAKASFVTYQRIYYKECSMCFEKNVCSAAVWWNVLYMYVSFLWLKLQFKSTVSMLIFCLDALSTVQSGISKSLMISVLSISPFRVLNTYVKVDIFTTFSPFPSTILQMTWFNFPYVTSWSYSLGYPPICRCS